jgi:hypothetical protein
MLMLSYCCIITTDASPIEIHIHALDFQVYQDDWEENDEVSLMYEGINITLQNKFTKILLVFRETLGRDVILHIYIPAQFMSPSVMGLIESDGNVTLDWRVTNNNTIISFDMHAFQTVTLTMKKVIYSLVALNRKSIVFGIILNIMVMQLVKKKV